MSFTSDYTHPTHMVHCLSFVSHETFYVTLDLIMCCNLGSNLSVAKKAWLLIRNVHILLHFYCVSFREGVNEPSQQNYYGYEMHVVQKGLEVRFIEM